MKRTKILYWVFTIIFAAFMLLTAIPDILMASEAVSFMTHLGYPKYFIMFIGVAKVLGSIAILIPGYPRIKEWAYAGLFYDLIGAVYSIFCIGEGVGAWPIFVMIAIGVCSYIYYHKRLKENTAVIPA